MKRAVTALLLVLCLLVSAAGFAEEKIAPLYIGGVKDGGLRIRFFDELPHVPYMGIGEYAEHILRIPMTMETDAAGVVTLRNSRGGELVCDPAAGTVSTPDWISVITPEMPLEDFRSLKDSTCAFVRITEVTYEGEPTPVTFDFAKYGMKIFADSRDVYIPLSVLSGMMTDIATRLLRYDGENLYMGRLDLVSNPEDPVLTGSAMTALMAGEKRPDDLIRQCYAGLCFNFDYFFGHPGVSELDAALAEKGLDRALEDLGEEGRAIREGLLSDDITEYLAAMSKLFAVCLCDGHTGSLDTGTLLTIQEKLENNKDRAAKLGLEYLSDLLTSAGAMKQILRTAVTPQRKLVWGDAPYREYGRTAIIRLDTFLPDEKAWDLFYKGEGPFPDDCVGSVVTGLRRAKENPMIENVLFDVSCNGGGSSDVLMMILGLTTGKNDLPGRNTLTGQSMHVTFETDNNFDGVFDEKDREARFDFNYGVLTTRQSFSCGNLFPIVMRESGAVVIGEPSGGGSCCIQAGTDDHGIRYIMSSCQWTIVDEDGTSVEAGCKVDIPLRTVSIQLIDRLAGALGVEEGVPVFINYFNEENLNALMNAWFHITESDAAA